MSVGADARVGARSTLLPGADVGDGAEVAAGSAVFGPIPAGEAWSGAPALFSGTARGPWGDGPPPNRPAWLGAYAASAVVLSLLPIVAVVAGLAVAAPALTQATGIADAVGAALLWLLPATVVGLVVLAGLVLAAVRLLSLGLEVGHHPVHGRQAWQAWSILRVLDEARTWLFPLYSSGLTPAWLRALGADIGSDVEASTVLMIPPFVRVGSGAFLADDTLVGGYELGGGWLRVEHVRVGKGAFVGNSGMAAPGRRVPKKALVAVLSAAPQRGAAKAGTSWLGSPPRPLRRDHDDTDTARTYAPPRRLKVARALVEVCRVVPVWLHVLLVVLAAAALAALLDRGPVWAVLLGGPVLLAVGLLGGVLTVLAKWLLVGRMRPSEHPAVELVRLAQRAGRHLRRGGRRAVVRARLHRHRRAQRVAAGDGLTDRPGRLVRDLLAARGRPHRPAGRRHRRPGLCRANSPVPRPHPVDGSCHHRRRRNTGPELGDPSGRPDRPARHRRPGLPRHAR